MEQRGNFTKEFVEGVGWVVKEFPAGLAVPQNASVVQMPAPEPAQPVRIVTADDVPLTLAQEVLSRHGFVAVPKEVVDSLPKTHQETLNKAADQAPAALDDAARIAQINAAATMDELDILMDGVTSPAVIAAAEAKAMELTEGGDK